MSDNSNSMSAFPKLDNALERLTVIEAAARNLFDNRLGWANGRPPYAPAEIWNELAVALYGAGYSVDGPPDTSSSQLFDSPIIADVRGTLVTGHPDWTPSVTMESDKDAGVAIAAQRSFIQDTDLFHSLSATLNSNSAENGSNTPDFILAKYVITLLSALDKAINSRSEWYRQEPKDDDTVRAELKELTDKHEVTVSSELLLQVYRMGERDGISPLNVAGTSGEQ